MSREWRALVVVAVLALEGVIALVLGFAPFEVRQAWLATLALWITGACGLLAWLRVPSSRTGLLLIFAAAAWGVASGTSADAGSHDPVERVLGLGWAAIAVHAIATFPTGRARPPAGRLLFVVAGYLATALPVQLATAGLAAALVGGLALAWAGIPGRTRPVTIVAAVALASGLAAAGGLLSGSNVPIDPRLASEAGMVVTALLLSTALVRSAERSRRVEAVLLELGPGGGDALTVRLASILEDPTLRIGYWIDEQSRYFDPAGRPMALAAGNDRVTTVIARDGRKVALLEHAPGRLTDAGVLEAIGRAADLGSINARLQNDVERQRAEVDASRRRLGISADEGRRKLTLRLEEILDPRLAELESDLMGVSATSPDGAAARALTQVREARRDVAALVDGLAPRVLDRGLVVAITELASGFPVPVTVHAGTDASATEPAEAALYFVCSEVLANVAKHARATKVDIRLERVNGSVELEIRDDGIGGADASGGTGLRGLGERVEALGGSFSVLSPLGGGTAIRTILPFTWVAPSTNHLLPSAG